MRASHGHNTTTFAAPRRSELSDMVEVLGMQPSWLEHGGILARRHKVDCAATPRPEGGISETVPAKYF